MKCPECSTEVPQTPGKRAKHFCNNTCRVKYWQKKKKEQSGPSQKKAGRPKKVLLDPVSPAVSAAMFNAEHPNQHTEVYDLTPEQLKEKFGHDPVSLGVPKNYDAPKLPDTVEDEFRISKMVAVVSFMEDVALAKKHIEGLKKKPDYSPYDNPRFKSKNNLK